MISVVTDLKRYLDDANSVSNIKSIVVLAQSNVAFFQSPRSNESIDLFAFDVVEVTNGSLDLTLVRLDINNENQCVAVFDQFH
jgi:hypothetical protein